MGLSDWGQVRLAARSSDLGSLSFSLSFSLAAFTHALERRFREVDEDDEASSWTCSELELLETFLLLESHREVFSCGNSLVSRERLVR